MIVLPQHFVHPFKNIRARKTYGLLLERKFRRFSVHSASCHSCQHHALTVGSSHFFQVVLVIDKCTQYSTQYITLPSTALKTPFHSHEVRGVPITDDVNNAFLKYYDVLKLGSKVCYRPNNIFSVFQLHYLAQMIVQKFVL